MDITPANPRGPLTIMLTIMLILEESRGNEPSRIQYLAGSLPAVLRGDRGWHVIPQYSSCNLHLHHRARENRRQRAGCSQLLAACLAQFCKQGGGFVPTRRKPGGRRGRGAGGAPIKTPAARPSLVGTLPHDGYASLTLFPPSQKPSDRHLVPCKSRTSDKSGACKVAPQN